MKRLIATFFKGQSWDLWVWITPPAEAQHDSLTIQAAAHLQASNRPQAVEKRLLPQGEMKGEACTHMTPFIKHGRPACCKHTLLFHVSTHALHVLHLLHVYLDAPGCRSAPTHLTRSFSGCFLGTQATISGIFPSISCLPAAVPSLWLIRGSQDQILLPPRLLSFNTFLYLFSKCTPHLNPLTCK